jgi:hypothetical protein
MNIREECYSLINDFSDEQLTSIVAFFKDVKHLSEKELEEILDEQFCTALLDRYDRCADKDDKGTPIEEIAQKWGIDLYAEDDG